MKFLKVFYELTVSLAAFHLESSALFSRGRVEEINQIFNLKVNHTLWQLVKIRV